ncbi:hypothetical protein Tco_0511602 [Tanacetum coccineum]
MSKPPSPCNQSPNENFSIAPSNQASIPPHSPPLLDSYVDVILEANQDTNPTPPPPPPSPTRERLIDDINQLQDLSNLLAMHFLHHTTPSSPYSPNFINTIPRDSVDESNPLTGFQLQKNRISNTDVLDSTHVASSLPERLKADNTDPTIDTQLSKLDYIDLVKYLQRPCLMFGSRGFPSSM